MKVSFFSNSKYIKKKKKKKIVRNNKGRKRTWTNKLRIIMIITKSFVKEGKTSPIYKKKKILLIIIITINKIQNSKIKNYTIIVIFSTFLEKF